MAKTTLDQLKSSLFCRTSHQWGGWILQERTCAETRICSRCHAEETRKTDHLWCQWSYVDETCIQQRSCVHCWTKDHQEVHDWGNVFNNKHCGKSQKCRHCGLEREVRPPMHSWVYQNTSEYNCGNGHKVRECKVCHQSEVVLNSKHEWEEWIQVEPCRSSRKCSFCGAEIEKVEHAWDEWVFDDKCNTSRICRVCCLTEQAGVKHDYERIYIEYLGSRKEGSGDDYSYTYSCKWKCKRCGNVKTGLDYG